MVDLYNQLCYYHTGGQGFGTVEGCIAAEEFSYGCSGILTVLPNYYIYPTYLLYHICT